MKRVIKGQTYNTDTATRVARYGYTDDKEYEVAADVYRNRGGAYFIVHCTMRPETADAFASKDYYFEPIDRAGLDRLIQYADNLEIIDSKAMQEPPEAEDEDEPAATIYFRLPDTLKDRIVAAASDGGLSVNAWLLRCAENCLTDSPVSAS